MQPAAPAAPAPAAAEAPAAPPLYNEEEQTAIIEYEKNWPDVARAESLRRRAEYHDLAAYIFQQVAAWAGPQLEQVGALGNIIQQQELAGLVPGYSPPMEAEVQSWIDTQPSYLQAPMKQVMQSGTTEEVADLIGRYRDATGSTPPAAPQDQAPAAAAPVAPKPPAKPELSPATKQAVASLAPVSGERSVVPQSEDKSDFNSAFAQYAASTG